MNNNGTRWRRWSRYLKQHFTRVIPSFTLLCPPRCFLQPAPFVGSAGNIGPGVAARCAGAASATIVGTGARVAVPIGQVTTVIVGVGQETAIGVGLHELPVVVAGVNGGGKGLLGLPTSSCSPLDRVADCFRRRAGDCRPVGYSLLFVEMLLLSSC